MDEMNIPTPMNAAQKRIAPKILPMISAHDGEVQKLNTTAYISVNNVQPVYIVSDAKNYPSPNCVILTGDVSNI